MRKNITLSSILIIVVLFTILLGTFQIKPLNKKENIDNSTKVVNVFIENKLLIKNFAEKYEPSAMFDNKYNPLTEHERESPQLKEKLPLNKLASMVYSGIIEQQHIAMEYLPMHGVKSLQLLLYLINSSANMTLKELALIALSNLEPSISNSLLKSLNSKAEFHDFIFGLGIVEPQQEQYWSPYQEDMTLFRKKEYYNIGTLLVSSDIEKRKIAIEQIGLLDDVNSINLLHSVISKDESVVIRQKALILALQRFPEQSNVWIGLMLSDTSSVLQNMAVEMLDSYSDNFEHFAPALIQILFNDSSKNLKEKVKKKLSQSDFIAIRITAN